jgi:hypothetical protein
MHLLDVMQLARRKLGQDARFICGVDVMADNARVCRAEVFTSSRQGANVPNETKTKRVVGTAPFVARYVDEQNQVQANRGHEAAVEQLAAELERLPDL